MNTTKDAILSATSNRFRRRTELCVSALPNLLIAAEDFFISHVRNHRNVSFTRKISSFLTIAITATSLSRSICCKPGTQFAFTEQLQGQLPPQLPLPLPAKEDQMLPLHALTSMVFLSFFIHFSINSTQILFFYLITRVHADPCVLSITAATFLTHEVQGIFILYFLFFCSNHRNLRLDDFVIEKFF
ncbi:uncharacterized protein LOC123898625 isoform X1 [Trifolium pratense]|uniref:uncharacterized protein LOC123898625 isoform X1 n=1 Tax=Trifolium pratense TaxID=57577 RepID=UPI001E693106|nr:uncharacterized protein LOC123898625 isoform X1 [Trifolium pratense]